MTSGREVSEGWVTDGPFVESKEIIGGYALMEIKYEAEATESGRRFNASKA